MKNTTVKQKVGLTFGGFIRVDGLKVISAGCNEGKISSSNLMGRWDENNGIIAIYPVDTEEVWIAVDGRKDYLRGLIQEMAPNGQGAWVPCSSSPGDYIPLPQILRRVNDPGWNPSL